MSKRNRQKTARPKDEAAPDTQGHGFKHKRYRGMLWGWDGKEWEVVEDNGKIPKDQIWDMDRFRPSEFKSEADAAKVLRERRTIPLPPKPMTTQECRRDPEFPAAFLAATAVVFGTRANGDGENGWVASMAVGQLCAEHFVRRLREGQARVGG